MVEEETQPDELEPGGILRWRIHPAAEHPIQGLLLIGIIGFCTWLFWSGYGQFYGIFCLAVLLVAMAPYFLPTSYEMDEEGVTITSLFLVRHFRPWSDFRSYHSDNVGAQLSPFSKPSRLAAFRGNFIRFTLGNRKEVIAFLDEYIRRERLREKTGHDA